MKTKIVLSATALVLSMWLVSCGPKDSKIQTDVNQKLTETSIPVTSTVVKGVVTLEGTVETEGLKQEAYAAVENVKGVKSVINNVNIVPPAPKINKDEVLAKLITKNLYDAGYSLIKVHVSDSIATLTGEAKKKEVKRITDVVSQSGAKKVISQITLK